ncbi:MAG TPA: LysM domain-containing protein [Solirubrobacteraceae bacterium]|nr:LysM domain-containing protein [Solirubrobacteraceae bacterium]
MTHRSPGRFLAPLALLAAVVAVALVVSSATGGEDDGGSAASGTTSTKTGRTTTATSEETSGSGSGGTSTGSGSQRSYTVKAGDTLGSIADDAGITIEELQELNPEVDPQSLTVGQRLRLRR